MFGERYKETEVRRSIDIIQNGERVRYIVIYTQEELLWKETTKFYHPPLNESLALGTGGIMSLMIHKEIEKQRKNPIYTPSGVIDISYEKKAVKSK